MCHHMPSDHYISVWCAFRQKFLGPYLPPNALSVFVVHPFKYTMIRHHQQFCKSDIGENSELYKENVQTLQKLLWRYLDLGSVLHHSWPGTVAGRSISPILTFGCFDPLCAPSPLFKFCISWRIFVVITTIILTISIITLSLMILVTLARSFSTAAAPSSRPACIIFVYTCTTLSWLWWWWGRGGWRWRLSRLSGGCLLVRRGGYSWGGVCPFGCSPS